MGLLSSSANGPVSPFSKVNFKSIQTNKHGMEQYIVAYVVFQKRLKFA